MSQEVYALEMRNIFKGFPGVQALSDVSIKVRPGSVHALMGENGAGKSTLMKCAFGIYHPDSGEILIEGKSAKMHNSIDAMNNGICMIHQELHPVKYRNVMENIWMGRIPVMGKGLFKFVDNKKMYKDTKRLFEKVGIDVDPKKQVSELSSSTIQLLEIARSVSYNSKVIIMDEPTSSITDSEAEILFKIINELVKQGTAIIYISHKLEEVLRISDEVTIMRDGQLVGTFEAKELDTDSIIKKMVGRDISNRYPAKKSEVGEVVLEIKGYTAKSIHSFENISFELRKGEILGIGGLVGSQRTELMDSIFGLREITNGQMFLNGKEIKINSPMEAIKHKMALLTEERRATGIFPILSILENTVIVNQKNYENKIGLLNNQKRKKDAENYCSMLNVKTPDTKEWIQNLSGGNQQKVLLARWLLSEPDILILDEPTRGIDVGAKYEIYSIMVDLAMKGKSIIMISSEMPELIGMSDRIMVMCEGHCSGFLNKEEVTDDKIMRMASIYES